MLDTPFLGEELRTVRRRAERSLASRAFINHVDLSYLDTKTVASLLCRHVGGLS